MTDLTPRVPAGKQVIQSYGGGRFRIAGAEHVGSVVVFPDRTVPWPVADAGALDLASLVDAVGPEAGVEVLLLGTGARAAVLAPALRAGLRARGIVADAMSTGAACRTFNVLLAEGRRVAAALIAVP